MHELAELEATARALLPTLDPVLQGPLRAAIEQIARARRLAEGGIACSDLESLSPADLAKLIRTRREAAELSQSQLARRAQISVRTVKNLERCHHPPNADTLRRLLAVPELGLIAADLLQPANGAAELNACFLPAYDRRQLVEEMRRLLNSAGGALDQTYLYLDDAGAEAWLRSCHSPRIQSLFRAIPHEAAARCIADRVGEAGVDVVALGSGDGTNELRLCQALLETLPTADLHLFLLDVSHPLLNIAFKHAQEMLPDVHTEAMHGDFRRLTQYDRLLPRPETAHRRRLYTMLGCTLSNLDNEPAFWRDQLRLSAPGDLAIFDFQVACARPQDDPVLQSPIPPAHLEGMTGPLLRYGVDVLEHHISVELTTTCPVPKSYELGFLADVRRRNNTQQRYLLYRVRRYDPVGLVQCMADLGWQRRLLEFYGPDKASGLLLLERALP